MGLTKIEARSRFAAGEDGCGRLSSDIRKSRGFVKAQTGNARRQISEAPEQGSRNPFCQWLQFLLGRQVTTRIEEETVLQLKRVLKRLRN